MCDKNYAELLNFDPATHTYTDNGKVIPSVTQILQAVGVTPNYPDNDAVRFACERGTYIHGVIEKYCKTGEKEDFVKELTDFVELVRPLHGEKLVSEQMIYNRELGYAGTVDNFSFWKDGTLIISDTKTGTVDEWAVKCQMSLYAEAIPHTGEVKAYCFDANKEGQSRVLEIPLLPRAEVFRLLDCYEHCIPFNKPTLTLDEEMSTALIQYENNIANLEARLKELESAEQELRALLITELKSRGLEGATSKDGRVKVSYIKPSVSRIWDSAKIEQLCSYLKKDTDSLKKDSVRKESVRITVK